MKIGDNVKYNIFDRYRGQDITVYARVVDKVDNLVVTENLNGTRNYLYEYQLEKAAKNGN